MLQAPNVSHVKFLRRNPDKLLNDFKVRHYLKVSTDQSKEVLVAHSSNVNSKMSSFQGTQDVVMTGSSIASE